MVRNIYVRGRCRVIGHGVLSYRFSRQSSGFIVFRLLVAQPVRNASAWSVRTVMSSAHHAFHNQCGRLFFSAAGGAGVKPQARNHTLRLLCWRCCSPFRRRGALCPRSLKKRIFVYFRRSDYHRTNRHEIRGRRAHQTIPRHYRSAAIVGISYGVVAYPLSTHRAYRSRRITVHTAAGPE